MNSNCGAVRALISSLFQLQKNYALLLRDSAESNSLRNGRALHACIHKTIAAPPLTFLSNSLISMYSKTNSSVDARKMFDEMADKDTVSFNTLIRSHGFSVVREMLVCGIPPDELSFVGLLQCSSKHICLTGLIVVHCVCMKLGFDRNAVVANCLMQLYAGYHSFDVSLRVFDEVEYRDVILINSMMGLLSRDGYFEDAFLFFRDQVIRCYMVPSRATFVNLLAGVGEFQHLRQGVQVHGMVVKYGLEGDGAVENTLVKMYSNCGYLENSMSLLKGSGSKEVKSWTTLIVSCVNQGLFENAISLFHRVHSENLVLDNIFVSSVLSAAAGLGSFKLGSVVHAVAVKQGFGYELCVIDSLMDMYAKCGCMEDALKLFHSVKNNLSLASWTAIIYGYNYNGFPMESLICFRQMIREEYKPDSVTCVSVLTGCINLKDIDAGKQIHAYMIKSGCETDSLAQTTLLCLYSDCGILYESVRLFEFMANPDVVSWTALISAQATSGCSDVALMSFVKMTRNGIRPNHFTLATALTASATLTSTEAGKSLHSMIIKVGLEDDKFVGTSLIDMYSKCGIIEDAVSCFMVSPKDDAFSWNALLTGYACHGFISELFCSFKGMQDHGVKPDGVTFLAILSGCRHSGYVAKIISYYNMMRDRYSIEPELEHCTCIVDAFGRARLIKEAVKFIESLRVIMLGSELLRSMISSCLNHGFIQLGLAAVAKMVILGETDDSSYVLTSKLYAAEEKWIRSRKAREAIDNRGTRKNVGKSWTVSTAC